MLTRLKVDGFKNLVDVDICFGPFTCIAGANGVGKSNLFDAIRFLSALADHPFLEAAKVIRDEKSQHLDIRGLFHRVGDLPPAAMKFEAEMLVPREGEDSLGQLAKATTTFLVYKLELEYVADKDTSTRGGIRLVREELDYIRKSDARRHLPFKASAKQWRDSQQWRESLGIDKRTSPFISTDTEAERKIIKVHQDRQDEKGGGRTKRLPAASLPRTVLSDSNASESPTALLARLEMRSWKLLQLEPSALRQPDEFTSPNRLGMNGAFLAKSLYNIAHYGSNSDLRIQEPGNNPIYAHITNRLSNLLDDVKAVRVDKDEKRELFTLEVAGKDLTFHPARALSDGTLRFLALAVLELERSSGVLCLEEPENGIHPQRIKAMLDLLRDIAVDTEEPVDESDNPLRQVIVNTHSPAVVLGVQAEDLVVAYLEERIDARGGLRFRSTRFGCLPGTWRAKATPPSEILSRGKLLAYLNPVADDTPGKDKKRGTDVSVREHLGHQLNIEF